MSRMPDSKARRPRRQFDEDFKAQAVRVALDEGQSVGAVARDLDLTESALRQWVEHARADRSRGRTGLTTAEREELAKLRKENRVLRMEHEIFTKSTCLYCRWVLVLTRKKSASFAVAVPVGEDPRLRCSADWKDGRARRMY